MDRSKLMHELLDLIALIRQRNGCADNDIEHFEELISNTATEVITQLGELLR